MSDRPDNDPDPPELVEGELVAEAEESIAEVRVLPRGEEGTTLERTHIGSVPVAVVAATGGFLLGVASFLALRVLRRPSAAHTLARRHGRLIDRRGDADVDSTRSFLVDVHLLKR